MIIALSIAVVILLIWILALTSYVVDTDLKMEKLNGKVNESDRKFEIFKKSSPVGQSIDDLRMKFGFLLVRFGLKWDTTTNSGYHVVAPVKPIVKSKKPKAKK